MNSEKVKHALQAHPAPGGAVRAATLKGTDEDLINVNNEETFMPVHRSIASIGALSSLAVMLVGGVFFSATSARAEEGDLDGESAKIRRGFEISPVPLNVEGKSAALVGLGSYLVNAVADCNGCHSAGPETEYARGGNPYFKGSPPVVINQSTYLGGGRNFGSLVPGTPAIISRNLTPDRTGRPAGGLTFEDFLLVLRTGTDLDHLHPNCSATITTNCFPANQPFNGDVLQIMPWPVLQHMSRREIRAIYEYLRAVPCIVGPPTGVLHNDCF
jgi:hypothetical protein